MYFQEGNSSVDLLISETKEIFMKSALQMMCKLTDCVNCIITLLMINEN